MIRVGFIAERRYLKQPMTEGVMRGLRARGAEADLICPQECNFEPETGLLYGEDGITHNLNRYDIIVSRIRNALGMALLSYANSAGIPILNSYAAVQRTRDKTEVAVAFGQAHVLCAPSILTDDANVLARLSHHWYPLILKAIHGDNSQGLRMVRCPEDLDIINWGSELVLAQHYLPNDGFDVKLYACGSKVYATRKPSPFNTDPNAMLQPIQPDQRMIDLTLRCGEILGLDIYGVDAIETPDGPAVIEVNDFPNFTGMSSVAAEVADYILARVGKQTNNKHFWTTKPTRNLRYAYRLHHAAVGG